jgi:DNA-binding NarL/FixJ family response regulator
MHNGEDQSRSREEGATVTGPVLGADLGSFDGLSAAPQRGDPLPAQRGPQDTGPRRSGPHTDVLLVDPDQATRESLRRVLSSVGIGHITPVASPAEVTEQLDRGLTGDLALVSLTLGGRAPSVINALRAAGWSRIVALSPTADIGPVIDAVGAGVSGVVIGRRANPAARNIPSSIHDLSSREIEVIRLVADGRSNKWIGEQLALSALTVKSHLARIGRKLGTGDRAHMVALAMRAGVIG